MLHAAPAWPSLDGMLQRGAGDCISRGLLIGRSNKSWPGRPRSARLSIDAACCREVLHQLCPSVLAWVHMLPLIVHHCMAVRCWSSSLCHVLDINGSLGVENVSAYT